MTLSVKDPSSISLRALSNTHSLFAFRIIHMMLCQRTCGSGPTGVQSMLSDGLLAS